MLTAELKIILVSCLSVHCLTIADIKAAVAMKVKETVDPRRPVELEVQYFPSLGFLVNITPGEDGFHPPHGWTSMVRRPSLLILIVVFGEQWSVLENSGNDAVR